MSNSMYFILALACLIAGYFVYGTIVSKVFGSDPSRPTPAVTMADGVDYVQMPVWKVYLIQILNIAGVGPVFGPILGALYGPTALFWIVCGSIFAGAVHDYFAGMLSIRYKGANVPTIVGYNLGHTARTIMQIFAVVLLVLVGVVFVAAPAGLLAKLTPEWADKTFWVCVIFAYYFCATMVPIDKLIGRLYPLFGIVLLIMAFGMGITMFTSDLEFYSWIGPETEYKAPIFPLVFITIACGALSGFHSTQSPLMARCLQNEKQGQLVFYGSMIGEGIIGLVWCTVGMTFYPHMADLAAAIKAGGAGGVVYDSAIALMGTVGGVLAVLGVVALPTTSGDTAFRAARLTIAEALNFDQKPIKSRLMIAIPMFIIGIALNNIDFDVIWRYFGFANQALACIVLWAGAAYLYRKRGLMYSFICAAPATFMVAVCVAYILFEPTMGLGIEITISDEIGIVCAVAALVCFIVFGKRPVKDAPDIHSC